MDYKTSTSSAVKSYGNPSSKLPYEGNKWQVKGYVSVLHRQGKPVPPWAFLVYIPRDNPFAFKVVPVKASFKSAEAWLDYFQEQYVRIATATTLDEIGEIADSRPCAAGPRKEFSECKWIKYCAGEDSRSRLDRELKSVFARVENKLPVVSAADLKRILSAQKKTKHA